MGFEGYTQYKKEDAKRYTKFGWWRGITLGDVLNKAADLFPKREALVDDNSRLTYSQLRDKTDRLAIGLIKLGIKRGDCVLLQLPNWNEFVYSFFALQKIGAVVVCLLPIHSPLEIDHLCRLTRAVAWILPGNYRDINYLPIVSSVMKTNPQLKQIILVRQEKGEQFVSHEKLIDGSVLSEENIQELLGRRPEPTEVAIILPSGGTTGIPKVAPRTHNDYICSFEYKGIALEKNSHDVCLVMTPLGHQMSQNSGVFSSMFSYGKTVLLDSVRPEDFCKVVQKERVTCAVLAPTLISRVLNFEGLKDYDLSSLTRVAVGGAASLPDLVRLVYREIGCKYCSSYGSVEGTYCQIRMDDAPEIALSGSVGRPCCPYDMFKVMDQDGKELPPNTEGELIVKGPCVFTGYLGLPEENKRIFTEDGFYRTGDLAIIDSSGYIKITGRIKDIIIRGGENISAAQIEELIITHPDVKNVAVIGMPDEDLGERVCAYIEPAPGAKPALDDIVSFLKTKGAAKLLFPERIEIIDDIPLTKVGKPDKKVLREDIKRRPEMI